MSCRVYHDRSVPPRIVSLQQLSFSGETCTHPHCIAAGSCNVMCSSFPREGRKARPGRPSGGQRRRVLPCSALVAPRHGLVDFTREPPHAPAPTSARHWMPVVSQASRPARAMRRTGHWIALPCSDMSAAVWEPPEIPRQAPALAPRGTKRIGNANDACPLHVRPKHFPSTLHLHR